MDPVRVTLIAGWIAMLGGVISGMVLGLRFHRQDWLGGYASFPRRLLRLGHIAFFGLGFVNQFFALSVRAFPVPTPYAEIAAVALVVGALTMPLTCFLTAWRAPFRQMFPLPVVSVLTGIASALIGWGSL